MYYHISITNNFLFIDCHAKFEVITFLAHFYHNVPKMYCVMKIWFAGIRHWNKSRHKTILLLQNCDENVKSAKKIWKFWIQQILLKNEYVPHVYLNLLKCTFFIFVCSPYDTAIYVNGGFVLIKWNRITQIWKRFGYPTGKQVCVVMTDFQWWMGACPLDLNLDLIRPLVNKEL